MNKLLFFIKFIFIIFIIFIFCFSINSFAAYPKLVSTIVGAFEEIKSWIIKISTPAAAVAVRDRGFYEKI